MIDTDKYEGHTPPPWDTLVCSTTGKKWVIDGSEDSAWKSIALIDGVGENDVGWKNMTLMADAPLLLAEVKRLRGVVAKVWDLIQNSNHEEREMFFWGFNKKNTGWIKRYEELAMKELKWEWWGEEE